MSDMQTVLVTVYALRDGAWATHGTGRLYATAKGGLTGTLAADALCGALILYWKNTPGCEHPYDPTGIAAGATFEGFGEIHVDATGARRVLT